MRKSISLLTSLLATSFLSAEVTPNLAMGFLSNDSASDKATAKRNKEVTKQPGDAITPSLAPVTTSGAAFMFSADFIWWKSTLSGMEYAASGLHDGYSVATASNVKKGSLVSPKYEFQPGFKIAAGMLFTHDGWDLNFQYTWLNEQNNQNSISATSGRGLASSYISVFSDGDYFNPDLFSASAKWTQSFNVVDAELGRNFFISRYLTLRPHMGMKFGWINAKLDLEYNTLPIGIESGLTYTFNSDLNQNMWGLGIRGGVDTVWHATKNWGVYGDLALSTLWSFFNTSEEQSQTFPTPVVSTVNTEEQIQKIVNILELSLGVCYMTWFNQDKYRVTVQAGWEEQIWMDFNNFVDLGSVGNGNLNIQGLTAKVGFAF